VKVSKDAITMQNPATGNISVPYGMAVWSTGIGTRPFIVEFMKQIGQGNRRVLATDEWLRVRECDDVYAIGDCATINQRRVMEDIAEIFKVADKDKSGTLTVKEIQDVLDDIYVRYPQVQLYLKSKQMNGIADLVRSAKGDAEKESVELNIEEFKKALSLVDSQVKFLPATAQVASQQGQYLATCFNKMKDAEEHPEGPIRIRGEGRHRFRPFRFLFHHLFARCFHSWPNPFHGLRSDAIAVYHALPQHSSNNVHLFISESDSITSLILQVPASGPICSTRR